MGGYININSHILWAGVSLFKLWKNIIPLSINIGFIEWVLALDLYTPELFLTFPIPPSALKWSADFWSVSSNDITPPQPACSPMSSVNWVSKSSSPLGFSSPPWASVFHKVYYLYFYPQPLPPWVLTHTVITLWALRYLCWVQQAAVSPSLARVPLGPWQLHLSSRFCCASFYSSTPPSRPLPHLNTIADWSQTLL